MTLHGLTYAYICLHMLTFDYLCLHMRTYYVTAFPLMASHCPMPLEENLGLSAGTKWKTGVFVNPLRQRPGSNLKHQGGVFYQDCFLCKYCYLNGSMECPFTVKIEVSKDHTDRSNPVSPSSLLSSSCMIRPLTYHLHLIVPF